jgi:hypothetical protein
MTKRNRLRVIFYGSILWVFAIIFCLSQADWSADGDPWGWTAVGLIALSLIPSVEILTRERR